MNQRKKFNIKSALRDKAHRILPLLLIPILIVSFFSMSVSAASGITAYSYRQLFHSAFTDSSGSYDFYRVSAPVSSYQAVTEFNTPAEVCITNSGSNSITDTFYSGRNKKVTFYNFKNDELLRVDDIPDGSVLRFDIQYSAVAIGQETKYSHPIAQVGLTYLDENYKAIKTQQYKFERNYDPIPGKLFCEIDLDIPANAKYCRSYVVFSHIKTESSDITEMKWEILKWDLCFGIPLLNSPINGTPHKWLDCNTVHVDSFPGDSEHKASADFKIDIPESSFRYTLQYWDSMPWVSSRGKNTSNLFNLSYGSSIHCIIDFFVNNEYLDISNLPDGSRFLLSVKPFINVQDAFRTPIGTILLNYLDSNGNELGSECVSNISPNDNYEYLADLVLDSPDGTKYCTFTLLLQNISVLNDLGLVNDCVIYLEDFDLHLRTDSSFVDLLQNQNQINQNNTIINGTPEQNQQINDANDKMESAGDKLGDLNDQMQVEKPDADDMDVSIDSLVPGTSILAYTQPILEFWENPTLKAMLIIVMTLVLVSWVMFGKKG